MKLEITTAKIQVRSTDKARMNKWAKNNNGKSLDETLYLSSKLWEITYKFPNKVFLQKFIEGVEAEFSDTATLLT